MKNIVIAIDLTILTEELIRRATQIAKPFNAKLWLLHIAAPNPDFVGNEAGPQHVRDERASELREEHRTLQSYARRIREQDLEAESLLIEGPVVKSLLEEARDLKADLLVIGAHSHSPLFDKLFGSTDTDLIKQSTIPLLIIPERPDEGD
jgi:nucleotide-binding universal stress UspA family protein